MDPTKWYFNFLQLKNMNIGYNLVIIKDKSNSTLDMYIEWFGEMIQISFQSNTFGKND